MSTADPERLPWIDLPPSAAARKAAPSPRAARRARTPLFAVLALFLLAGVGVMSYLAGRGWESMMSPAPETRSATLTLPAAQPAPPPVKEAPAPVAVPEPIPRQAAPKSESRAPVVAERKAEAAPKRATRAARAQPPRRRAVRMVRAQPRLVHASKVVQLGSYARRRHADAAYRRLVRVYPYLRTLPKTISVTRVPPGYPRIYRLQLRAHSPDHARILCQNLLSIGRGCRVLPAA